VFISRNVKPLQAHGSLEVEPEEDARSQPFRLTPQGKRLIQKAVPAWQEASARLPYFWGMKGSPCSTK
jgi:DNA-binding MarR family transcriptional regulator